MSGDTEMTGLAGARARIAELEAQHVERDATARVNAALYRIAETSAGSGDLQAFYASIHAIVADLMYAENFYISLYDPDREMINFPYFRDSVDPDIPGPSVWEPFGIGNVGGLTAFVLRTGHPQHVPVERLEQLVAAGEANSVGSDGMDWLGVPLQTEGQMLGVLVVQTYRPEEVYSDADVEVLAFVGQHVATALTRKRAVEEIQRQNAELAVVSEIGAGLAAQLEFDAIIDLVGDRIRDIFATPYMYIALYDEARGVIRFPYEIEDGRRPEGGFPAVTYGEGLTSIVIRTREPLLLGTEADQVALGALDTGGEDESYLGVPMIVGDRVIGVIAVAHGRQHAFDRDDVRLLSTLASSTAAALDNARLFDEARRRTAELEIIRRVSEAMASQLELEALIELVGQQMRDIFEADIVYVALLDEGTGQIDFPYYSEDGNRLLEAPMALGEGLTSRILISRQPMLLNRDDHFEALGTRGVGTLAKSWLGVPILVGDDAIGVISVQSSTQEGRFGERETALLSTLAASVGAAIQTARLFHERELSEVRSRRLVEELPLAVYTDKPDETSTSTYMSPIVEEMFGYPHDEWLREGFFMSVVHPDDRDRITGQIVDALGGADQKASYEYRILAADGRVVWVRDDVWIVRDDDGTALYSQGFMLDMTDQVLAAAEIRRQKQYFESLVEISPAAVVTMDRDEIVTGWNPAAVQLFGYEVDEAVGTHIDRLLFAADDLDEGRATSRAAADTGRTKLIGRRSRKDGNPVDVEIVLVPLVVDGEHTGYYAIYHDITELQAARSEADAANAAKSTFLASMSHEIRTPMNAIIGMSGLLVGTPLDPEQRDYAETIRASGEALLTIINDILDFSKIEAGRIELDEAPFALGACLEGALDVIAPAAAAKGIELAYSIDPDLPFALVGDAGRIRQIVLNLLSNSVKFTEQGEVVVTVTGRRLDRRRTGSRWEFDVEVADTGIGISADRMDRLFQSFSQADASISRRYGGTGLGLVISRRLAELMGGSLNASSEGVEGRGSTFRLRFQAAVAPDDAVRDATPALSNDLAGKQVLVVDDSATNRRILVALLRRWGMVARESGSPREALGWVRAGEHFDLGLFDHLMPEIDGAALAALVREATPGGAFPVVIVTSAGQRWVDDPAVAASVTKPVKPSPLLDTIQTVLAPSGGHPARIGVAVGAEAILGERHPLRILLAEDNAVNQKLAIRLLRQMGYTADIANNGLEVLEALERSAYDVVLMDVQMPELDGLEATRRIRQRSGRDAGPRIVAMTANAMAGDREACLAAGMDDYVSKPIHGDALEAALLATTPTRTEAVDA